MPKPQATRASGSRPKPRSGSRNGGMRHYASVPIKGVPIRVSLGLGAQQSLAAFAIAGLMVILLALLVLPEYSVKTIGVKGNQGMSTDDLVAAVSFVRGSNAFLLRTQDIVAALRSLSGVEKAEARVVLPDRVEITVKDVRPDVMWQAGSQVVWVDNKGIVRDQPPVLPERKLTVTDLSGRTYKKDDQIDRLAVLGAQQLSVLMQRELAGFEFQREGELILVSNQGWRAQFSTRGDLNKQVDALRKFQSSRSALFVDVRVPGSISYH